MIKHSEMKYRFGLKHCYNIVIMYRIFICLLAHLKTCDVGFTETVPDAPEKFELWRNGRSEVFLLQVSNFHCT